MKTKNENITGGWEKNPGGVGPKNIWGGRAGSAFMLERNDTQLDQVVLCIFQQVSLNVAS